VTSLALIASLLFSSLSAVGQTSTGNWNSVQSLTADSKVWVKLKTGKTVDGRFRSASDSSLTLTGKNGVVDLKRDDVASVCEMRRKSATKSTMIGLGVGAGAGAALGAAVTAADKGDFDKLDQAALAGVVVIGALAGTVTGYFLGRKSKKVLVYESK
jgi:hypothetical protein